MSALGSEATLEKLAAAFARPMMHALSSGGRDLAVMRIVARSGIDPRGDGSGLPPGSIGFVPTAVGC